MTPVQPRIHHYSFTYRVLREAVFKAPDKLWRRLRGDRASVGLSAMWKEAGRGLGPDDKLAPPSPFRVTHSDTDLGEGWEAALIHLPEPERPTEASIVAMVYREGEKRLWVLRKPAQVRYYALEKGFDSASGAPRFQAALWRVDGSRVQLGGVSEANEGGFLMAIAEDLFSL